MFRQARLLAAISLALSATGSGHAWAQSSSETIVKKYKTGVVALTTYVGPLNQKKGTGFLIADDIIITNEHVVRDAVSVFADFFGGTETIACKLIDSNADLDLAALKLERKASGNYPTLTLSDNPDLESDEGADVVLIGSPVKLDWSIHKGIVAAKRTLGKLFELGILKIPPKDQEQRVIQLNVSSTFGMSGAPVLNTREHVVGVQRLGYEKGEYGINFCIPSELVRRLDTTKSPMDFNNGAGGGPTLNPNLQAFGLKTDNAAPNPSIAFNVFSKAWGFLPNDPDYIFANYIGDPTWFQKLVPKSILQEILQRAQDNQSIVHVTNPYFGYSMLVPNWFHIQEYPAADNRSMVSVITYDTPVIPEGLNKVTIFTRKIKAPGAERDEQVAEFHRQADWTLQNQLKLTLVDINNQPVNPGRFDVVLNQVLSDEGPRVHASMPVVRSIRVFDAPLVNNRSYWVLYALSGDTFTALTFEFETSEARKQGDWNPDWVERLLIAGSMSLLQ